MCALNLLLPKSKETPKHNNLDKHFKHWEYSHLLQGKTHHNTATWWTSKKPRIQPLPLLYNKKFTKHLYSKIKEELSVCPRELTVNSKSRRWSQQTVTGKGNFPETVSGTCYCLQWWMGHFLRLLNKESHQFKSYLLAGASNDVVVYFYQRAIKYCKTPVVILRI